MTALVISALEASEKGLSLADVKVMEYFGIIGKSVCTATIVQGKNESFSLNWVPFKQIEKEIESLAKTSNFKVVKIGFVENSLVLKKIIQKVKEIFPEAIFVWEPKVSCLEPLANSKIEEFLSIMPQFDLVITSQNEFNHLGVGVAVCRDEISVGRDFSLLLKGSPEKNKECVDILFHQGKRYRFVSSNFYEKEQSHFKYDISLAVVASLVQGKSLVESCQEARSNMDKCYQGK